MVLSACLETQLLVIIHGVSIRSKPKLDISSIKAPMACNGIVEHKGHMIKGRFPLSLRCGPVWTWWQVGWILAPYCVAVYKYVVKSCIYKAWPIYDFFLLNAIFSDIEVLCKRFPKQSGVFNVFGQDFFLFFFFFFLFFLFSFSFFLVSFYFWVEAIQYSTKIIQCQILFCRLD
jgi:hypothetical protein